MGSSNDIVISTQDLGICYRKYQYRAFTLKEVLVRSFRMARYEPFWAVRNATFQVRAGESLGIIGPNGAGKSTLLKALTRVLPPAEGSCWTRGRIAPLIEIGGGFNTELTARENVYMHGAIMGFTHKEMDKKLSKIIEFAEVEDFVDVPLHSFSSGMRARFAFACATDVDPDILILDEVFSVGDERFRQKSLARMNAFFESNKTIITVTHSLGMVRDFCTRCLWMEKGQIVRDGPPGEVIDAYRAKALGE